MAMKCAPIVLFVFNRQDHVQKAVEALQKNELAIESELYIYSDGARNEKDVEPIEAVREYCRNIAGFAKVHLVERHTNWGIEKSEIDALTGILQKYESCIVLEDDLEVSSRFLEYMNRALEYYKEEKKVISIAGYTHIDNNPKPADGQEFYFSQMITSWGWATWADRWALFDGEKLNLDILEDEATRRRFDMDGACPYTEMLRQQVENRHITWDVAWYFKAFENDLLTLTPVWTLVNNIGMDGSGVHYNNDAINNNRIRDVEHAYTFCFPDKVELDVSMREQEKKCISRRLKRERFRYRMWKLRTILKGLIAN